MHVIANILTAVEWTTMGLAAVVTVGFWGGAAYLTSGRRRLANIEYEQERQRKQVNRLDLRSQGPEIETPTEWKDAEGKSEARMTKEARMSKGPN